MKPEDRDIKEAFAALDRTVPDGYWDDFSSRVLARLDRGEADAMERDLAEGSGVAGSGEDAAALALAAAAPTPRGSGAAGEAGEARDGAAGDDDKPEEHSGLHEIQALASTTRRHLSRRQSSESDADESLLLSSSSGALRAVALPDPSKTGDSGLRPATLSAAAAASPPPSTFASERRETRSAAPFWIVGGVATLAAAAAVAVFVFGIGTRARDGDGANSQTVARADVAPATGAAHLGGSPPAATSMPAAAAAAPSPSPVAQALDEGLKGAADQAGATAPGHFARPPEGSAQTAAAAGPASASHDAVIAAGDEKSSAETQSAGEHTARGHHRGSAAPGDHGQPASTADAHDRSDRPAGTTHAHSSAGTATSTGGAIGGKDKAPAGGAGASAGEEGEDLDKVLDRVTGKVDEPAAPQKKKPAAPAKKELDRRDVAQAMAGVKGAVQRCHALEGYEGTVSVHFVVAATGKVSKAAAVAGNTGRTGSCVAAAVKLAHFPVFDGPPMSFTYPFLLSE